MSILAKLILGCIGLILFVIFGSYLIRELLADRRLRRQSRTVTQVAPRRREYTGLDWPAWQRDTTPGNVQRLRAQLRELGE